MADGSSVNPVLSIIIPIYNVERYLEECLLSIQRQTYADYEVLMIDDGSIDGSADICKRFAKDKRFIYIYKENGGVSAARNTGLDKAKGKYISFIDADDYISLGFYESIISVMETEKADICVCTGVTTIEEKYNPIREEHVYAREYENDFYEALINVGLVWDKVFKKELFDKTRFDESMEKYEDLEIFAKILHVGVKLRYAKNAMYFYRVRNGSLSHSFNKLSHFEDLEKATSVIEQFCKDNIKDEKIYCEIKNLFKMNRDYHKWQSIIDNMNIAKKSMKNKGSVLFNMLTWMQ